MESNHQKSRLILTGRTGAGKSTLANVIANQEAFKVGNDIESMTEEIQERDCFIRGDPNLPITLIDTPGDHDNRKTRKILSDALNSIKQAKKGFNVLLHCFNGLNSRFDSTDIEDMQRLSSMFTKDVVDHIYIGITHLNKVSDTEGAIIIQKYKAQLTQILRNHHITGIEADKILFFNSKDPKPFIDNLTKIIRKKRLFQAYQNVDLSNPIAALQNPDTSKLFKSIIESWKEDLKSLKEFKDESSEKEMQVLKLKIYILEILINKRGCDLETILKSIKDKNPFCEQLAHFFLSTSHKKKSEEEKEQSSVYQIAHKLLKNFDSTYKEKHSFKKGYAEILQKQLDLQFLREIEESLTKIINKNLEKMYGCSEGSCPDTKIDTSPALGVLVGIEAGSIASLFSSTLIWTVSGASSLSQLAVSSGICTELIGSVMAAEGALLGLTAASATGIGLLVFAGVLAASFFCWTKDGTIKDIARAASRGILKSDISKHLVITTLITFCDIAQQF